LGQNKVKAIVEYDDAETELVDMEFVAEPAEGELPEGQLTTSFLNGNSLFAKGSELIAHALFVDQDGSGNTVEVVEFYLNGRFLSTQDKPPFFVRFKPDSAESINLANPPYPWELEAVGIDQDGNIVTKILSGNLDGFPLVAFPSAANMTISILGQSKTRIIDGSPSTVNVNIQGQASTLNLIYWGSEIAPLAGVQTPNPYKVKLYANGIFATESLTDNIVPTLDAGNNVLQLNYRISYNPSFISQAKPDGRIKLTANLQYPSLQPVVVNSVLTNDEDINIIPPTPWVDYASSLLAIRSDLLGSATPVSAEELQAGQMAADGGTFFNWVEDLTNKSSFKNRLDLIVANHIITGSYYSNFTLFNEDIQEYITTWNNTPYQLGSVQWYKQFINDSLQDSVYQSTYGEIPYLVGDYNSRNLFPYSANRLNLINQFMTNKWGQAPTYSQKLQGSKKLMSHWLKFQPNYWEALGRDDGIQDTPPRRDTITPFFYESGELAVELVWQLASETQALGGVPWIFYTINLRDSQYTAATVLALLLQNEWEFDQAEINKLSGYSKRDILKYIIEDERYQKRYHLIWKFAETIEGYPNWKKENWFGSFNDQNFPWIYHSKLGWLYHGSNTTASMYLYWPEIKKWIWTSETNVFPWIYIFDDPTVNPASGQWVFLDLENETAGIPIYLLEKGIWKQLSDW
jgi:hypothetical protein